MIQDIHSHTYYSFCGQDSPEEIVEAAIAGGIEVFGICDHNYGIGFGRFDVFSADIENFRGGYGRTLKRYFDHINLIAHKYRDQIKILKGIEVTTKKVKNFALPANEDISYFDYCLLENLDLIGNSITDNDVFTFADRCGCKTGIAHTDMFKFLKETGEDPYSYFKKMSEQGIFWEMNVNYDSIHKFREHQYVIDFFASAEQQDIVKRSGVEISVGFDGHRVGEYNPQRVIEACNKLEVLGIRKPFDE